jgi:hypothetical protein
VIADIVRIGHALSVVVPEGDAALPAKAEQCQGTAHQGKDGSAQSAPANRLRHISRIQNGNQEYKGQDRPVYPENLYHPQEDVRIKQGSTRRRDAETEQVEVRDTAR